MGTNAGTESILPEALQGHWGEETAEAFAAMSFNEQTFVVDFIRHGTASKAYRKTFPNISEDSLYTAASAFLRRPKVAEFLEAFKDSRTEDLFFVRANLRSIASGEVQEVEYNGTKIPSVPDVKDRLSAIGQISKLSGLNAAEKVQHDATDAMRSFFESLGKGGKA